MSKTAFLFPGQGSQYVGMAKDIYENSSDAKMLMEKADDLLSFRLTQYLFAGPEETLKQTEITQPAIFLHSVVVASLITKISPQASAGHSLGEYSALVCAGAVKFEDALKLVRARGLAMKKAGDDNKGTLAAIVGLEPSIVEDICRQASSEGIIQCANFNSPGQVVVSGAVNAIKKAVEIAKTKGARMAKELVVSGAFHSPLMEPAKNILNSEIEKYCFDDAKIPVYANVTAKPNTEKEITKKMLIDQLTSPVRWEETIVNMIKDGYSEFYEIGPGKVLQGLVKRINPDVKCFGVDKFSELERLM